MSETDAPEEVETPDYIRPDQFTLGLEGSILDLLITEDKLSKAPAISMEPDKGANRVTVHLPFFINGVDTNADELAFSENFVHTQLDLEKAHALRDQLDNAINTLEENTND